MSSTEENEALVRGWSDGTNQGNLAIIDELCAPDYIDHKPSLPGMGEGSHAVRRANETLWTSFPDTVHIIEAMIAEGDLVVTRLRGRATFKGEILGISPNNKVIEITGISIHRIANGELAEHWANADLLSFLQQMGAIPTLAPDTSATH